MDQILPQQTMSGISGGGELTLYNYFIASPLFAEFIDLESEERKLFMTQYIDFSPALKAYFASTETAVIITEVGSASELEEIQITKLAGAIRELIMGNIFIKDFPSVLATKLNIIDTKAGEIANQVIAKSFGPILDDVKRIQRSKFPDKITELRKEGQPSGLNKPPQIPTPGEPRPKNEAQPPRLNQQPVSGSQSVRPPLQMPPRPPIKPGIGLSQQTAPTPPNKHPQFNNQKPSSSFSPNSSQATQDKPPLSLNQRPLSQDRPSQTPSSLNQRPLDQNKPTNQTPQKPQFKIPDLGPSFAPLSSNPSPKASAFDKSSADKSDGNTKTSDGHSEASKGKQDFSTDNPPPQKKPDLDLDTNSSTNDSPENTKQDIEKELKKMAGTVDLRSKSSS